jgi:hypothetical protein
MQDKQKISLLVNTIKSALEKVFNGSKTLNSEWIEIQKSAVEELRNAVETVEQKNPVWCSVCNFYEVNPPRELCDYCIHNAVIAMSSTEGKRRKRMETKNKSDIHTLTQEELEKIVFHAIERTLLIALPAHNNVRQQWFEVVRKQVEQIIDEALEEKRMREHMQSAN